MQARRTPQNEPGVRATDPIVETETVETRQRVVGAPGDVASSSRLAGSERTGGYFETLPERLGALGLVVLTALEGLLAIRFLLRAFGANPSSGFVGFINDVSWPFVRPFTNIFSNRSWDQGTVEISTLVAMGVYLLAFALIGMLIAALTPRLRGDIHGVA